MLNRRYAARREYFGFLIYDRFNGDNFILKYADNSTFPSKLRLKSGPHEKIITDSEVDFNDTTVLRNDILVGPIYTEVYITRFCNERCEFCYVGPLLTNKQLEMDVRLAGTVALKLKELGAFEVALLGGEPFLHSNLANIIEVFSHSGIRVAVSTNGTILDKKIFDLLANTKSTLNISFHSHIPEIHAKLVKNSIALSKLMETVNYLVNKGYAPNISMVLNELNLSTAKDTVAFLLKIGIKNISLYHLIKEGFAGGPYHGISFADYKKAFLNSSIPFEKFHICFASSSAKVPSDEFL